MRLTIFILLIAFFFTFGNQTLVAWPVTIDFNNHFSKSDTSLDNFYGDKENVERLFQINKHSAVLYINQLIKEALDIGDSLKLSDAYYLKGVAYYMDGNADTAAEFFIKAAELASIHSSPVRCAAIYTKISNSLFLTQRSEEASYYLGKAWDVLEQASDCEGLAKILITLVDQFDRLGLTDQYVNFIKLIRMNYLPFIKDSQLKEDICLLNASHMAKRGNLKIAFMFYFKAKEPPHADGISREMDIEKTLSVILHYSGQTEKAVRTLQQIEKKAITQNYLLEASYINNLIAHFLQQIGKNNDALDFQRKAMHLREKVGFRNPLCSVYINYAIALRKAGLKDSIPFYLEKALRLAQEANYLSEKKRASEELTIYYRNQGDYKRALFYLKNTNYFENQITNKLYNDQKKMLSSKIISSGTQEEIYSLRSKMRANYWLMILLSIIGILMVLAFVMAISNRRRESDLQFLEVKRKILVANLNPIFIFNSLAAIKNIIREGRNEEAGRYLSSFARLIRVIMVSPQIDYHPIEKELQVMENYFQLQKIWLVDRFSYKIEVSRELQGNRYDVPPFFCHPILEQIIYSAQAIQGTNISATMSAFLSDGYIRQQFSLSFSSSSILVNEILQQSRFKKTSELIHSRLNILNKSMITSTLKANFNVSRPSEEVDNSIIIRFDFPQ